MSSGMFHLKWTGEQGCCVSMSSVLDDHGSPEDETGPLTTTVDADIRSRWTIIRLI